MLEGTRLNPFEKTSNQEYYGFSELLVEQRKRIILQSAEYHFASLFTYFSTLY